MVPRYSTPRDLVFKIIWAGLAGRQRDLRLDAQAFGRGIHPRPRILGEKCIPECGPFLLVVNHYYRPGFEVWRLALAISAVLPMLHTWVTSSEWTAPGKWYGPVKSGLSRAIFHRLAKIYGLLPMPPMPPRPQDAEARAAAVRRVLAYFESRPEAVVCLAPEGRDVGTMLGWPPSGVGRFISLLAGRGLPILPVGGWEEAGELVIRFGVPYRLEKPAGGGQSREETDRCTAETVMRSIAGLLPQDMRGEFG